MVVKVILIIILIILVAIGSIFFFTRKVVATGNEFFDHIANDNTQDAYELLLPEVKSQFSYETFAGTVHKSLTSKVIMPVSWNSRSVKIQNGRTIGSLNGLITMEDKTRINVELQLAKSEGVWKVSFMKFTP